MKTLIATAALAVLATSAFAGGNFQQGGSGPLKVESVMIGIKSPASNACPANATAKFWIYTNKPGTVSYMTIREGVGASAVKTVQAKKVNGKYVAAVSQQMVIEKKINTRYRVAAKGAGDYMLSNWAPLKANCTIMLGG
ncbi:hypothetical protein [Oricola sp.]|uniref:hypothetical protein n=1 Tax=Oricola sp. TaxID=1979950 RepID=UPI003BA918C5